MARKIMRRTIQGDSDLRKAALHVNYEIRMLGFCAEHLGSSHSSPATTPEGDHKNMALNSFLIHFRNIRGFLCPLLGKEPVVREDDILASDFLKEPMPRNIGNDSKLALDKERIDKMLSHLSYTRGRYIEANEHHWPVARMRKTIWREVKSFLAMLPSDMQRWFPAGSR